MRSVFLGILIGMILVLGWYKISQRVTVTTPITTEPTITYQNPVSITPKPVLKPVKSEVKVNVPILMYHYIRVNPDQNDKLGYALSVTPEDFASQLDWLIANNYTTVTLDDLVTKLKNNTPLPSKPIVLTFDDGYQDFYTNAYPELKKRDLKATSYIVTSFVGEKDNRYVTWAQIKEMDESGLITIGSHTLNHANLTSATSMKVTNEIVLSKNILEKFLGHKVLHFCYPSGLWNEAIAQVVARAGYTTATTTQGGVIQTGSELYNLTRVRVNGGTTLDVFEKRLDPEYHVQKTIDANSKIQKPNSK